MLHQPLEIVDKQLRVERPLVGHKPEAAASIAGPNAGGCRSWAAPIGFCVRTQSEFLGLSFCGGQVVASIGTRVTGFDARLIALGSIVLLPNRSALDTSLASIRNFIASSFHSRERHRSVPGRSACRHVKPRNTTRI